MEPPPTAVFLFSGSFLSRPLSPPARFVFRAYRQHRGEGKKYPILECTSIHEHVNKRRGGQPFLLCRSSWETRLKIWKGSLFRAFASFCALKGSWVDLTPGNPSRYSLRRFQHTCAFFRWVRLFRAQIRIFLGELFVFLENQTSPDELLSFYLDLKSFE